MKNNDLIKHGQQVREKILQAIIGYIQQHGYPPTMDEIGEMVGLKSKASIKSHLDRMHASGMIETDAAPGSPRAIRVPGYKFVKDEVIARLTPVEVVPYAPSYDPSDTQIIDCPNCKGTYYAEDWGTINFCPKCGQALEINV